MHRFIIKNRKKSTATIKLEQNVENFKKKRKKKSQKKIKIWRCYKDTYKRKSVRKLSKKGRENVTKRKRDLCGGER